jgi:hypothetical protein
MRGERGQVTIFIILALVIVVIGVLIYAFMPGIRSTSNLDTKNPVAYIQDCLQDDVENAVYSLALNGGSKNPTNYYSYNGDKVEYLCYAELDGDLCNIQKPLIYSSFERELERELEPHIKSCFEALRNDFDKNGYNVLVKEGDYKISIIPEKIYLATDYRVSISKDSTETYDSFDIFLNNNIYELLGIAKSIAESESRFGRAPTDLYLMNYVDLKIEPKKQIDDTTIYVLTHKKTGEVFQFASRSLPSAPGVA